MAYKIQYIDRLSKQLITEVVPGEGFLNFFYHSPIGKLALHGVIKRKLITSVFGRYMSSKFSTRWIDGFIKKHKMDLSEYFIPDNGWSSFNDFFYRKIKPENRPIGEGVVSPADGKVVVFENIDEYTSFYIKGKNFDLKSFLNDDALAQKFNQGSLMVVRLAPTDYHRYHFPAEGSVDASKLINGFYFSVSPIAMKQSLEIFCENKREYSIQKSKEFGDILICDVGATMVGSIIQTYEPHTVLKKGDEKGYFAFGGSTLVLLFEKDKVKFSPDLLENTAKGIETQVLMGQTIATSFQ